VSDCPRRCKFGYLGTDEIPTLGAPITEGRIGMHLEFRARCGDPTKVRLCPCQTDPEGGAERARRASNAWRLEL
jgi:hypothetical protein